MGEQASILKGDYVFPPFGDIKPQDFVFAIEQVIDADTRKFKEVRDCEDVPSFANTVVALEEMGRDIERISTLLGVYQSCQTNDEIVAAAEEVSTKISAFNKVIFQDQLMAARFRAVYDARATLGLDENDSKLLEDTYFAFEGEGAFLKSESDQKRIKEIDEKLISVCLRFDDNLLKAAEKEAVLFTDVKELEGLAQSDIDGLRDNAKEKALEGYLFVPERLKVDEFLTKAKDRNFREKIFKALARMGTQEPYNNEPLLEEILNLRNERAQLLGYENFAAYSLSRKMAGDVATARGFLAGFVQKLLPQLENEMQIVSDYAVKNGGPAALEPWDVLYWASQYKQEKFSFDPNELSQYLELENVVNGFIAHAEELFKVAFVKTTDVSVIDPEVRSYEILDRETGKSLGIMQMDLFERPGRKGGGAWAMPVQSEEEGRPLVAMFCANHAKPSKGQPSLMGILDVETLYHEGGHALNQLLGAQPKHQSQRGFAGDPDFVEIHSTAMESWAFKRECLKNYAFHWKTGALIPEALIEKMEGAKTFFASYDTVRLIQNSLWDLDFHSLDPGNYKGSAAVQKAALLDTPFALHLRPYPLTRFTHLFSEADSGYAAGYFSYAWAEVRAADVFSLFREKGLYDPETSARLKRFYQDGGGRDPNRMVEELLGRPVSDAAYLKKLGAKSAVSPHRGAAKLVP